MNEEFLSHLRFADNVILFSESGLQEWLIKELHLEGSLVGLKMNMNKLKVMLNRHTKSFAFSVGIKIYLKRLVNTTNLCKLSVLIPTTEKKFGIELKWDGGIQQAH